MAAGPRPARRARARGVGVLPRLAARRAERPFGPGGGRSAAGGDRVVALRAQDLQHHVTVVALQLDDTVLDGAADTAALLQLACERLELGVAQRQVVDRGDALAAPTGHLALDLHALAGV